MHFVHNQHLRSNRFEIDTHLILFLQQISPDFQLKETSHLETAIPERGAKRFLGTDHLALSERRDLPQPVKVAT